VTTPAALQALKVPGTLIVNPTTNPPTDAAPHGGTELGLVKDVRWVRRERSFDITAEEYGSETAEVVYLGEEWEVLFTLRGYDADALSNLFPNIVAETNSATTGITYPDTTRRAGSGYTSSIVSLLFSPEDPYHHAVYFRAAIPMVAEELEVKINRTDRMLIAVGFKAVRDATTAARSVQVRLLEHIEI
jgi:hypothetical protein